MKLKNIFKIKPKKTTKSNVKALDKKQLANVIGGTEADYTQAGKAHYGAASSG